MPALEISSFCLTFHSKLDITQKSMRQEFGAYLMNDIYFTITPPTALFFTKNGTHHAPHTKVRQRNTKTLPFTILKTNSFHHKSPLLKEP